MVGHIMLGNTYRILQWVKEVIHQSENFNQRLAFAGNILQLRTKHSVEFFGTLKQGKDS